MLNKGELRRYSRQIAISGFGQEAQKKLKKASVFIAGAGGLGCSAATYLAEAGIGRISIVDPDNVKPSNLNRQILHWEEDMGRNKADSAAEKLKKMNRHTDVEGVKEFITAANIARLVKDCDMIIDAVDNLPTRHVLNEAAVKANIPFFHGAVYGFEGRAMTIIPGETACLSCVYPVKVPKVRSQVIGVTPAVIGCIQATEVIKYITGIGQLLKNKLLIYDGFNMKFTELKITKDSECKICGRLAGK